MRIANVEVSSELLIQALHLPPDTRIVAVRESRVYAGSVDIVLQVEHEGLRDVQPGDIIPPASPKLMRQDPIVFTGWGQ